MVLKRLTITLFLIAGILPCKAQLITEIPAEEYFDYIHAQGGVIITNGLYPTGRELVIPSHITIDGEQLRVVGVGAEAFSHSDELESLTISDGIEFIGEKAFAWCGKLANIQLGEGLISLGKSAFYGAYSLRSITLPASLQSIGTEVFWNCHNLNSIKVREGSRYMKSDGQVLYTFDGSILLCMPQAYHGSYCVPDGVKHIADWGMVADSLTRVSLPDGLQTIGENAFFGNTRLENINIPASVFHIGEGAFVQCHSLKELIIPEGITELPRSLFFKCKSLSKVILPHSLTAIGEEAFERCEKLQELSLPPDLVSIGNNAFRFCNSLKTVNLPSSLEYLGEGVFANCGSLITIDVSPSNAFFTSEDGVLMNREGNMLVAFPGGRVTRYAVRDGIVTIASGAFYGCGLKEVILPSSLRTIEDAAFSYSKHLREVTIPEGVNYIGDDAFYFGWDLEALHMPSTVLTIGKNLCKNETTIYVPDAVLSEYVSGPLKPKVNHGTPPAVKLESEYVPAEKITVADLTQKLLGMVHLKKSMWNYTLEELKSMIPESVPVQEPTWNQDFALKTDKRLDLSIGIQSYKIFFIRFYISVNGKADVQETSIDCGNETDKVARAIAEKASKLKFKLVKRSQTNENCVMMIDKKHGTALFIIEDKDWERVFVVTVDVNSDKMQILQTNFEQIDQID